MTGVARGPANANVSVGIFEEFFVASKQLAGQVALVTGVNKRIGRSIALRLAAEGASVAVNYRGAKKDADDVVREILAGGAKAVAIQADVTKRESVVELGDVAERDDDRPSRASRIPYRPMNSANSSASGLPLSLRVRPARSSHAT